MGRIWINGLGGEQTEIVDFYAELESWVCEGRHGGGMRWDGICY